MHLRVHLFGGALVTRSTICKVIFPLHRRASSQQNVRGIKSGSAAKKAAGDCASKAIISAGDSQWTVVSVEIVPSAEHGVSISDERHVKAPAVCRRRNLRDAVMVLITKPVRHRLRQSPKVTSDCQTSFQITNHDTSRVRLRSKPSHRRRKRPVGCNNRCQIT